MQNTKFHVYCDCIILIRHIENHMPNKLSVLFKPKGMGFDLNMISKL